MAMKIAFIGGGNMGEAMLSTVLKQKLSMPEAICVSDINDERRRYLNNEYGIEVTDSNRRAIDGKDIVILAVKPQNIAEILTELSGRIEPDKLVISIAAGVKLTTLSQGFKHGRIVRVMPNMPALIGFGMSAWTATNNVTEEQKELAQSILGAMGQEIYFDEEKYLDIVTAVSASGPAYVFLLAESMIAAAVDIGLSHEEAEKLVFQTILGAAHLMQASNKSPALLRQNVTSRGGTTERALNVFEDGGFKNLVHKAIRAAYERAKELGD